MVSNTKQQIVGKTGSGFLTTDPNGNQCVTWNDQLQLTAINYKVTVQALVDVLALRTVFDACIVSLHVVVDKKK